MEVKCLIMWLTAVLTVCAGEEALAGEEEFSGEGFAGEEVSAREELAEEQADAASDGKKGTKKQPATPNVVIMLADDLGYGDLSYMGHPTSRTPYLDRLAAKSMFFTQFYTSSPVCSPSRASLLTGRLQVRSGVYPGTFVPGNTLGLPRNETTIAALLKLKGYRTMIAGKWHLGVGRDGQYLPTHFGFDEYLGVPYSHDMCPCRVCFPADAPCHDLCWSDRVSCPLFSNTTIVEQPVDLTSLTRRLVSHALSFVSTAAAARAPFFLYLPFQHVHHPQFASSKFSGSSERGMFGDALNELDWAVGQVMGTLRRLDIASSTLVWFTSDNGPSMLRQERGGSAGPLRCGKGTTWEGGVRVPALLHWPGVVTPGRSSALVSVMDVLPTLAAILDLPTHNLTLDGYDLSPLLRDPLAQSPRQSLAIYPEAPDPEIGPFAITNGTYKAHFFTKGSDLSDAANYDPMCPASHPLTRHDPPLLYHLHRDPGERYDLASDTQYRHVLEELSLKRREHMKAVTWMPARTRPKDPRAQPCCTDPTCDPFPACCDCPHSVSSPYTLHHARRKPGNHQHLPDNLCSKLDDQQHLSDDLEGDSDDQPPLDDSHPNHIRSHLHPDHQSE